MQNLLEERIAQAARGVSNPIGEVVAETLEAVIRVGTDSVQTVVLVRGIRALIKSTTEAKDQLSDIASAATDLEAFFLLLQEPTVQASLSECDPLAKAKIRGLAAQAELLAAEGGCVSSHEAAELIGLSPQAVDKARKKGQLVAFPRGQNRYAYPCWQFEQGHILKGLKDALQALTAEATPWTKAGFMLGKNTRLVDEQRPLDLLRKGKVDKVVAAAKAFGQHGAA